MFIIHLAWCFPLAPRPGYVGRYMNMIINVGPVLIGAYEVSCRAGKYGYDGWLSGLAWLWLAVAGCAGVGSRLCTDCSYSIDSTDGHHPVVTQHSACPAQSPSASRTDSLMWDQCLAGRAIWQLPSQLTLQSQLLIITNSTEPSWMAGWLAGHWDGQAPDSLLTTH